VISGSIMGSGAAKRLSAVRWGVAGNIVGAWMLTLPAAAAMGAIVYAITTLFGHGAIGPLIISLALLLTLASVFIRRLQQASPAPIAP
jgi:PiT family inorganic phosphate transporter